MNRLNYLRKEARRMHILGHIVNSYVANAMPVSSGFVSRRMGGNVSSATVRNIMGELEEQGYIEQPHTSAGRIPTNSGYRLYVDMIRERVELEKAEAVRLRAEYAERIRSIEEVVETTSRLISRELHNAGIVMWPSLQDFNLKRIELVKVQAETALAVLVTVTNAVKKHIISLDRDMEQAELEKVANYINSNYEHVPFASISERLNAALREGEERGNVLSVAASALKIIDSVIDKDIVNDIYWEGLNYFMDEPDTHDNKLAYSILQLFSNRSELVRLLRTELSSGGVQVHIGGEKGFSILRDCSMVTCGYELHGRFAGRIGVIGPTRMDYERALRVISCLSGLVNVKLEELN